MSGLERNMQMAAHLGAAVQHFQQFLVNLAGFNRADTHPLQPVHFVQLPEQVSETIVVQIIAVASGVNAGEYKFLVACLNQLMRLRNNGFRITAA
ncbi:hypothetical protein D3C80_1678460 [compost metagenome]